MENAVMGDEALRGRTGAGAGAGGGCAGMVLVQEGPVDRLADWLGDEMVDRPWLERQKVVTAPVLRSAAVAGLRVLEARRAVGSVMASFSGPALRASMRSMIFLAEWDIAAWAPEHSVEPVRPLAL